MQKGSPPAFLKLSFRYAQLIVLSFLSLLACIYNLRIDVSRLM